MKRALRVLLSPAVLGTLALLILSAIVWWFGPLLGFGASRPLESVIVRAVLIGVLWLLWIARLAWVGWRRRRTNAVLLEGIAAGPSALDRESQQLAQRFNEAMVKLRASRGRSWLGGGSYLYELPWYVFVGAPGSGKTTALTHAGLQFLLTDGDGRAAVRGVGGTRHCEWWFTQDAVLIDTAGRYATQESDRDVDAGAWDRFLALLKRTRPRQPINGVLLTVNVQDLLQQGAAEREEHAAKLRARLQELQAKLGLRAPVYVLVTKADLVGGFNESFEPMGKEERDQVWGFTFDPATPPDEPLRDYERLSRQLGERLATQLVDRLERERDPLRRAAIFAFPQEFAALQALLGDFLQRVFAGGGRLETTPRVRGVYFTSGTQEGSPIDRVMGALGRSFGIDPRRAAAGAQGRSYFLQRLLRDVVFAERGLGTVDARAERRRRVWRASAVGLMAIVGAVALVGWAVSRARNVAYAEEVAARTPALRQAVQALPAPTGVDVAPLVPVLSQVAQAARSESFALDDPPLLNQLGLYQGEKLDAAAQLAYQRLLQKALAPRVARRSEERLRAANKDQLEGAYESLKHYLMLYDPEHFDAEALQTWIVDDARANAARTLAPEQLDALDGHVAALLALGPLRDLPPRDDALVASVREMLVPFTLEHLAYDRIKRGYVAGRLPEFSVASAGGPNAAQVFERASGAPLTKGISGFFTREGYRQVVLPEVDRVVLQLAREQPWVRGTSGGSAAALRDAAPGGPLTTRVRRLYFEDYIKTWDAYLADVRLVRLAGLERSIAVARLVSAPDSPLAAYLRGVAEQTTLVPPAAKPSALDKAAAQATARATAITGGPASAGAPLERMVDDHFASVRRQVEGTPAPIDETLKLFNEVYVQLSAVDAAQKSKSPPPPAGATERVKSAAGQLPDPVRSMLTELADAGASQSRDAAVSGINAELRPVAEFCTRAIAGRYPFAAGAGSDVPPEDFGRFFGVGGLMDDFFQRKLADLVDVSGARWTYRPLADGSTRPSPPGLAEFQRAARIREVFFRSGGSAPSVKLELRALEIDPGLKELVLDIDGQAHRLAVGQPSVILTAPSPRNASQLKLSSAGGTGTLQFEGPWALFRLFDRFEVQPTSQPEKINVVLTLDGRRAKLEVVSGSVFNPFRLREVQQFRCPTSL